MIIMAPARTLIFFILNLFYQINTILAALFKEWF